MERNKVRKVAITAILIAVEVIFQFIGNHIQLGPVSINLTLLPIAIGAIYVGPFSGFVLGIVNGILVLFAPSTISIFMPLNAAATIVICLLKTSAAGFISGVVYNMIKNKKNSKTISSAIVPVINTTLFSITALIFYKPFLINNMGEYGSELLFLLFGVLGWNFIFELLSTLILAPYVTNAIEKTRL